MRALRSSRIAKFAAVTAAALGLAAGAAGSANAAGHASPLLTAKQMPQDSAFHWKSLGPASIAPGHFQWLYTCGPTDPTGVLHSSYVTEQNFVSKGRKAEAGQILFHFSSTAKAKAALKKIEAEYASCAPRLDRAADFRTGKHVHASVDRTAWIQDGFSYRVEIRDSLGRPAAVPDLPSDAQEFFVQRGDTISFVQIDGTDRHVDVTKGSLNTLKTMAARLG